MPWVQVNTQSLASDLTVVGGSEETAVSTHTLRQYPPQLRRTINVCAQEA